MDHTTVYIPVDENVIQVNVMLTNPVCVLTEDATRDLMTSKLPFYFQLVYVMLMAPVCVLTEDATRDLMTPKLSFYLQLVFGTHYLQNRFNTSYIHLGIFVKYTQDVFYLIISLNLKFPLGNNDSNYDINM